MPATQRMTADEYLALFVKGELNYALRSWARAEPGRGLVSLPKYPEEAAPDIDSVRPYPVPHLAVEIRSPSTWRYDIGAKAAYERAGLRELWLVDTAASEVLIFRRSAPRAPSFDVVLELEREDTLTSPQLDGFELPLGELFPE